MIIQLNIVKDIKMRMKTLPSYYLDFQKCDNFVHMPLVIIINIVICTCRNAILTKMTAVVNNIIFLLALVVVM